MSDTVYLVRAYSTASDSYIWLGGEQSTNIRRARFWNDEAEAQEVVNTNQDKFNKINDDLEARHPARYGPRSIRLEVVPMTRKELMVARLKE